MLLRGIKAKSMGYAHFLRGKDLPEKLARPEAEVLADLRNQPTEAVRDEVILAYTRLGMEVAGRYIAALKRPDKADVLVSAAIYGIIVGVDNIVKGEMKHDNLGGYLVEQMHFAISAELASEQQFGPTARTKRARRQRGLDTEIIKQEALTDDVVSTNSEIGIFEINEALESLNLSDLERQIIELRVQGFRDDYIGRVVGLSNVSVWLVRRNLQARYTGVTCNEKASAKRKSPKVDQ